MGGDLVKRLRHHGMPHDSTIAALCVEAAEALVARPRPMFYLVQREGSYGRGIVGVFSSEAKAEEAARAAADEERDGYHHFSCYELQSDMRVALGYGFPVTPDAALFILKRVINPRSGHFETTITRPREGT